MLTPEGSHFDPVRAKNRSKDSHKSFLIFISTPQGFRTNLVAKNDITRPILDAVSLNRAYLSGVGP